jgi:hypothetical protein
MSNMPDDKNIKGSAPEDIQRSIENLVDQGFSQDEIKGIINKINQTYFESEHAGQVEKELAERIKQLEEIQKRQLTAEEKEALRLEVEDGLKPKN